MKYFVVAGDFSGQKIVNLILDEIENQDQKADIFLFGGQINKIRLRKLLFDFEDKNIMGFSDIFRFFFGFWQLLNQIKRELQSINPDVLILVDYGGLNLKVAKFAKKIGLKVIYFIPPKTWAWNESRNQNLKTSTDLLIPIYSFEDNYFRSKGLQSKFFGNPLIENKEINFPQKLNNKAIGLLPGSRQSEINHHLPLFLILVKQNPNVQFILSKVENLTYQIGDQPKNLTCSYEINQVFESINFAFVCSGTASFEALIFGIRHVVIFKTNWLNFTLAKKLIKVRYISLVNLILNRPAIVELIQDNFNIQNLQKILNEELESFEYQYFTKIRNQIFELELKTNCSKNIAKTIIETAKISNFAKKYL